MSQQEDTGFKVTDRRKFNADGSPRETSEAPAPSAPAEKKTKPRANEPEAGNVVPFPAEAANSAGESTDSGRSGETADAATAPVSPRDSGAQAEAERAYKQAREPMADGLPEASFLSLINMLGVEAAMLMGLIQTPGEDAPAVDLESARLLIDTLGILQAKTRGNLTADETNLLENILADLRMQFVAISRKG